MDIYEVCADCGRGYPAQEKRSGCPYCLQAKATLVALQDPKQALCNADPTWLRTIRSGILMILAWIPIAIVLALLVRAARSAPFEALLDILESAYMLAVVYMISAIEPGVPEYDPKNVLRSRLRTVATLSLVFSIPTQIAMAIEAKIPAVISGTLVLACAPLMTWWFFGLLKEFAARVPDRRLFESTEIVKWGSLAPLLAFCAAVPCLLIGVMLTGSTELSAATTTMLTGLTILVGLCMLIFGIWGLTILYSLSERIRWILDARPSELPV